MLDDIFSKAAEFVLNGGLFGMERGFDRKEEGHIYGIAECREDLEKHLSCIRMVLGDRKEIDDRSDDDRPRFAI